MPRVDSPVVVARRHVTEFEHRVERQRGLLEKLERGKNSPMIVAEARKVLETLGHSLRLARAHLQLEIDHYGDQGETS
jgi:hypothetical protein